MADISQDQLEKVLQFQDLSGIEDFQQCKDVLQRYHWDIEVAVQSHLAAQDGSDPVFERSQARTPPLDISPSSHEIVNVPHQGPQSLVQWGYFIVLFPFRFVYRTVLDLLRFAYRLLRPTHQPTDGNPQEEVRNFLTTYELMYGTNHPVFYMGTYGQALTEAKRDLRFLLVCLLSNENEDSATFCRTTLSNRDVINFLNENVLMWICNVNTPEGYKVSRALHESYYPFLALVVLKRTKMTVVARIEGPIEPGPLISKLRRLLTEHENSIASIRAEREQYAFNQSLRDQQDQAYLESLKADQEKERRKREAEEEKRRQQQLRDEETQAKERKGREIQERKVQLRQMLPAEPDTADPDSITIKLKLPSGTQLERRFNKNHSLKFLHYFVFVHEASPDDFQIVTNFPRRVLPCDPESCHDGKDPPSFEEVGLGRAELLFVHDNQA